MKLAWQVARAAARIGRRGGHALLCLAVSGWLGTALAQPAPAAAPDPASGELAPATRSLEDWLQRLREGSEIPSFVGTYVVSSASGAMASARIWHVCEGGQELERVDALSGRPRSTYRHNQSVTWLLPDIEMVRTERRESSAVFPRLLDAGPDHAVAHYYEVQEEGVDRVAGLSADVVRLRPLDDLRFGYRIWSERETGLALKTQTLDAAGQVLEQAAFSEVELNLPLEHVKPRLELPDTEGWRHQRLEREPVEAAEQGWVLRQPLPGYASRHCYRRALSDDAFRLQWVFSDGLNTVSLFLEPFRSAKHQQERLVSMGATHAMSRQWPDADGRWWVTVVGEVPQQTLDLLFDSLARLD